MKGQVLHRRRSSRLIEGRAAPVSTSASPPLCPPLLQIKQVIMSNFSRQQLTASAEQPAECAAKSNFHLQGGWITSKRHAFPCSTADLVTLVLYFFK